MHLHMRKHLRWLIPMLAGVAVFTPAVLPGSAAHASSNCSMVTNSCRIENQYGQFVHGTVHGAGLNTGAANYYNWNSVDGVWGELRPITDPGLCWQWDANIDQINLEGCTGSHLQLWWLQSASGHYAIKNYAQGTTLAVWGDSNPGVFLQFESVYNAHSQWDFHT